MVATIKDVAKKAGVSIATVSNYLNNTNPVRKETATRIQAAIDSLGYKQNYMARNLKAQRYTDVGVILPDLDNPYYVQIFQGIEKTFHQSKYYLTLAFSYDDPEREAEIIDNLLKKQVAGLVLVPSMVDNWKFYYHHLVSRDKPLVILDRQIDNLETNFIAFENEKAIADLAKSLIDQGKRNLVLITGPRKYREEQLCIDAFLEVCSQNDIDINQALQVYSVGTSKEETFRITTNLLRRFLPDAILTTNGAGAVGIIESLSFLGYSTNDIPVATLGEERWNKYTHSISSLSSQRPAIQMGEQAAQLLLEQLKSPFVSENRRILMTDKILTKEPHPVRYAQYQPIQIDRNGQTLKVLLLDTYQTHALSGLFSNFTSATGIAVDATSIPHPELFERIIQESRKAPGDSPFDVVMFDIAWLYTLASSKVLADISPHIERKRSIVFSCPARSNTSADSKKATMGFPSCMPLRSCFIERIFSKTLSTRRNSIVCSNPSFDLLRHGRSSTRSASSSRAIPTISPTERRFPPPTRSIWRLKSICASSLPTVRCLIRTTRSLSAILGR